MSGRNRFNPYLKIEFGINYGETIEECANCRDEFTARAGFIAYERGTPNAVCDFCAGAEDLPLDFDRLAAFFDEWRKQSGRGYEFWRFKDGCFLANDATRGEIPFPAETLRRIVKGEFQELGNDN